MKIRIMVVVMIAACFISGCSLVDQFQQAKTDYVETKVVELLDEIPTEVAVVVEPVVVEPVAEATEEAVVEEKAADVEVTEEPVVTEEPTEETTDADLTPEATEEPDVDATPESSDPGVYLGDADWTDAMDTAEFWPTGSDEFTSANYENGKLKIVALSDINGWRIASTPALENAYIEANVTMGTCASSDGYGFIFRVPENTGYNRGYLFGITCDGRYSVRKWDGMSGTNGTMSWLQYYKASEFINKGKDQTNVIGVMMIDDLLQFFVNGEKVGEVVDSTYQDGFFGLYANRDKTVNLSILVDSVSYWTDPLK